MIDDDDDDDDADDEIEDDEEALKAGKYELKERKLLIKIPRRKEKYLNILAINKRAYIHASQLVQITGVYELVVDEMIKRLAATSPIKVLIRVKKFEKRLNKMKTKTK